MARSLVLLLLLLSTAAPAWADPTGFVAEWPRVRLWVGAKGVEGIKLRAVDAAGHTVESFEGSVRIEGLAVGTASIAAQAGVIVLPAAEITAPTVRVDSGATHSEIEVPTLNGALSVLPAVLAILLALLTRQVLLSLLGGIWFGLALLDHSVLLAFPRTFDLLVAVSNNADKLKIVLFTLLMGGMVGVVGASGGTRGIVARVATRATTAKSGQLAAWGMGMLIFFDDYASALLAGNTMRPITDRLRVSREKLSFIIDSTAAPVAGLAMVSTWVGYEVSVLADALKSSGIERDAYEVFLNGLPSRFYQIFALLFVLFVALLGRDFGPMLTAERRARREGKVIRDGGSPMMDTSLTEEVTEGPDAPPPRALLALVPIAVLILAVLVILWVTGVDGAGATALAEAAQVGTLRYVGVVLSNAASYDALVYAAALSVAAATLGAVGMRALTTTKVIDAFVRGIRAMTLAVMVLVLAWSIGKVMDDLRAGAYIAELVGATLPAWSLPTLAFLLAAVIAFATGTSWGTMAILFPVALPVVALHLGSVNFDGLLLGTTSAILGGAVFGDHCSPISDTTVLSSISCAADHVDHTRTQGPYALFVAAVSVALGYLPVGLGLSPWLSLPLGVGALIGGLRLLGQRVED